MSCCYGEVVNVDAEDDLAPFGDLVEQARVEGGPLVSVGKKMGCHVIVEGLRSSVESVQGLPEAPDLFLS